MLFNSFEFLVFFPVVVVLYFLIPHRGRWILLLLASYYFYLSWKASYLLLILASTLIDYLAGAQMSKHSERAKRKPWLYLSLLSNLGILFTFKYFNFFTTSSAAVLQALGIGYEFPLLEVLLPVGISFYTFQTLSYSIDVYYGRISAEKHLGRFALFVAFFPQLVAGPIERAGHLLPQFKEKFHFDAKRVEQGLVKMAYGLFKKVVVADRLAVYVDQVFGNIEQYNGLTVLLAVLFFAIQIYCDFSGYSDIAIGAARIMGFDLMENFKRPYLSRTVSEFWRRWHVSLSSWFRDYVYIPLGGNRVVKWRWYYNLLITFLVSGLWHGANWTFVIWGGLHGAYLMWALWTQGLRQKLAQRIGLTKYEGLHMVLQIVLTNFLVCFAWIFFRAENLDQAWVIIGKIAHLADPLTLNALFAHKGPFNFLLTLLALALLAISYGLPMNLRLRRNLAFLVFSSILIILLGEGGNAEFIYFQF